MLDYIIKRWEDNKDEVRCKFANKHPDSYLDVVSNVISIVGGEEYCGEETLDVNRIHQINDGDCQGTLVFVIGEKGYQPSTYHIVMVGYGSCSGCDTLQAINDYSDEPPTPNQVDQYMMLALHIVQGLKKVNE